MWHCFAADGGMEGYCNLEPLGQMATFSPLAKEGEPNCLRLGGLCKVSFSTPYFCARSWVCNIFAVEIVSVLLDSLTISGD